MTSETSTIESLIDDLNDEAVHPGTARVIQHDLRTPLNAITVFSEVLLSGQCGSLNGCQKDLIRDILSSANDMVITVDKLVETIEENTS